MNNDQCRLCRSELVHQFVYSITWICWSIWRIGSRKKPLETSVLTSQFPQVDEPPILRPDNLTFDVSEREARVGSWLTDVIGTEYAY